MNEVMQDVRCLWYRRGRPVSGSESLQVLVAYDGSPPANAAIEVAARLFPNVSASIAYLWTAPYANDEVRSRLWKRNGDLDGLVAAIEREGEQDAVRVAATGVVLARAAHWDGRPLIRQAHGGEGVYLAQLAKEVSADLLLVGSRGLGGARAFLGSVSDMAVHYSPCPVLVIPQPLLTDEYAALASGPVVVGWDASPGATAALAAARTLLPGRDLLAVSAGDDVDQPVATLHGGDRPATVLQVPRGHGTTGRAVAEALAVCAREHQAAAVVVGSRGRSAAAEIILGSVAMATLHHAHRPVLVVPSSSRDL
ncbi:universal stress protein [Actinoplanes sp. NPDC026670]|uniref:universal stress protein n=1 Tax=Actinoplanes sp. NPDC026670 TaxID=3154700 RepID=UPI0033F38674